MANAISELYRSLFGRAPDQGGLDYWTSQLNNGMSLDEIRNRFMQTAEYQQLNQAPQNQSSFNSQAYLQANPDVADDPYYGQNAYDHYINAGQAEGRQANFDVRTVENDDPYSQLFGYSPEQAQELYDLKSSNPSEYYGRVINELGEQRFGNYATNANANNVAYIDPLLQDLKNKNPAEYYKNELEYLGKQMGWQIGQNTSERNTSTQQQIQSLIPEALKAGVSQDELNTIISTGMNQANAQNQRRIADEAATGGSGFNLSKDLLPAAYYAIGGSLGMYGLDSAIGALAASGAGAAGSSALTVPEILASTGFVPAAGSGASFGIIPGATYTAAGLGGNALSTADILASTGFTPTAGSGASFSIVPDATYGLSGLASNAPNIGTYVTPELMGPTYQELGITGVEGGLAGPTYGELGFTGLNQAAAIAAANAAAATAASGSGLLSGIQNIAQTGKAVQGLLGGTGQPVQAQPTAQPQQRASKQYAGVDYSPILNLLNIQQPQRNRNSLLG